MLVSLLFIIVNPFTPATNCVLNLPPVGCCTHRWIFCANQPSPAKEKFINLWKEMQFATPSWRLLHSSIKATHVLSGFVETIEKTLQVDTLCRNLKRQTLLLCYPGSSVVATWTTKSLPSRVIQQRVTNLLQFGRQVGVTDVHQERDAGLRDGRIRSVQTDLPEEIQSDQIHLLHNLQQSR